MHGTKVKVTQAFVKTMKQITAQSKKKIKNETLFSSQKCSLIVTGT